MRYMGCIDYEVHVVDKVWGTWDARGMRYIGYIRYEVHGVHRV